MRDRRERRWLPPLGVAALVALTMVDIVLVKLALDHTDAAVPPGRDAVVTRSQGADAGSGDTDGPSSRPSSQGSTGDPAEPSEGGGAAPAAVIAPGPVHLALATDGTVLRATAGSCDAEGADRGDADTDPVQVAVARAGDAAFRSVPVAPDLAAVLAVDATSRTDLRLTAADSACVVDAYRGGAGRRQWTEGSAQDEWYLDHTSDPVAVHAPGGEVQVPCTPVALSALDAVRVLCEGGALVGTGDGGATWAALGRLEDPAAMAFEGPSRGLALARRADCPVTVLSTANGGAGWEEVACLAGEEGRAVALRGDAAVALVDDVLWRSTDGGAAWESDGG